MAKFGRFEFGKVKPTETYEGERMVVEKGYVKIVKGGPNYFGLQTEQTVAVVRLDRGESVRKLSRT
jgi:hypothetical protein